MKIFRTKRVIYKVEQLADGSFKVYRELYSTRKMNEWKIDGREYAGDASEILNGKLEDVNMTTEELCAALTEEKKANIALHNANWVNARVKKMYATTNEYKELVSRGPIDLNTQNITTMLRYLNTVNWGLWRLPQTNFSYSCAQHNCGGHTVTTIILKNANINGVNKFAYCEENYPFGYLKGYERL